MKVGDWVLHTGGSVSKVEGLLNEIGMVLIKNKHGISCYWSPKNLTVITKEVADILIAVEPNRYV